MQRRKAQNLGTDVLGLHFGSTAISLCDLDHVPQPQFPSLKTGHHENPTLGLRASDEQGSAGYWALNKY